MTKATNRYNIDNNKNNLVVDAQDWYLEIHVYMKDYDKHTRDGRQWKINDSKIYNLVIQHFNQGLKEELKMLNRWSQTEEDQDSVGILILIRDSIHGLKHNVSG